MPQFGKYELVSELASGGMAVTWSARLTGAAGVTKDVVIKQIHPHLATDPRFVQMFINEARMVASFSHGNIAIVESPGHARWLRRMTFTPGAANKLHAVLDPIR